MKSAAAIALLILAILLSACTSTSALPLPERPDRWGICTDNKQPDEQKNFVNQ